MLDKLEADTHLSAFGTGGRSRLWSNEGPVLLVTRQDRSDQEPLYGPQRNSILSSKPVFGMMTMKCHRDPTSAGSSTSGMVMQKCPNTAPRSAYDVFGRDRPPSEKNQNGGRDSHEHGVIHRMRSSRSPFHSDSTAAMKIFAPLAFALSFPCLAQRTGEPRFVPAGPSPSQSSLDDGAAPEELAPDDWSSISAAYEAARHGFYRAEHGHEARSHGNRWLARFDGGGFSLGPDEGEWSFGLELVRYGFESALVDVEGALAVRAEEQRLTYDWNAGLSEWWINDVRGLEHGFTVHERPEGRSEDANAPLVFDIAIRGDLTPRVLAGGRGVSLANAQGSTLLTYDGLVAFDADGRTLDSWIEVSGTQMRIAVLEDQARYPVTIDPVMQTTYLKASNTDPNDRFGECVAISGDTVIIGAPMENSTADGVNGNQANNSATNAGAAYVFVRTGTTWAQQAYLKASNSNAFDRFGVSVAISGETIVVGARSEDSAAVGINGDQGDNSAGNSGAAYVFVRVGGNWTQQAYLKASNPDPQDEFGVSVAVFEDTVVVGAEDEASRSTGVNGNQTNNDVVGSGAVYVFTRTGTTWSQQAYLKASNTDFGDDFGEAVAIFGDTVVVGSSNEDSDSVGIDGDPTNDNAVNSGAAHIFIRTGSTWAQQAYLKASNTDSGDGFGEAVAIFGDTVVIGSSDEDSNATGVNGDQTSNGSPNSGAVYVFTRTGTSWSQQAYLKASNTDSSDSLGRSIAISGDTLVVGASGESSAGAGAGQGNNGARDAGAAYVFVRTAGVWNQQEYLKANNAGQDDLFGDSIAIDGDTVVVGAPREDSAGVGVNSPGQGDAAASAGAAYLFESMGSGVIGSSICDPAAPNSTGIPAVLSATGFTLVALNQVTLEAANLPPNVFGFFLASQTQGMPQPPSGSQGTLCLAGSIGRFIGPGQIMNSGQAGAFALPIDLTQIPQPTGPVGVLAGETWFFQAWHRDTVAGQTTSNLTNGVEILFR